MSKKKKPAKQDEKKEAPKDKINFSDALKKMIKKTDKNSKK